MFLLSLPNDLAIKWLRAASKYFLHHAEDEQLASLFCSVYVPLALQALADDRSILRLITLSYLKNLFNGIDLLGLDDLEELNIALPVVLTLAERFEEYDFSTVQTDPIHVFETIRQIDGEENQAIALLVYVNLQILNHQYAVADEAIEQILEFNDHEFIAKSLFFYATVLAMNEQFDTFDSVIANGLARVEIDVTHLSFLLADQGDDGYTFMKQFPDLFNAQSPKTKKSGNDSEEDKDNNHIDLPDGELTSVIVALLLHNQLKRVTDILNQISPSAQWRILRGIIDSNSSLNLHELEENVGKIDPALYTMLNQMSLLIEPVRNQARNLLIQQIKMADILPQDDMELVASIESLRELSTLDDLNSLAQRITNQDVSRAVLEKLTSGVSLWENISQSNGIISVEKFRTSDGMDVSIQFQSPTTNDSDEDVSTLSLDSSPENNRLSNSILSLVKETEFMEAFDLAKQIESLAERLEMLRYISKTMAKQHHSQAKEVFDEAIRIARVIHSRSIGAPKGIENQELIISNVMDHSSEIMDILNDIDVSQPNRHRDTILNAVVNSLIRHNDFQKAEDVQQLMRVEPWRTEAQVNLIEALVKAEQFDQALALVKNAIGKVSRFRALCSYGAGLWHYHLEHARVALDEAFTTIETFRNTSQQTWAFREYALTLLTVSHPDADRILGQAIEKTTAISDMLTRFYGLLDLLDGLLEVNHEFAKPLEAQLEAIISEAQDTTNMKQEILNKQEGFLGVSKTIERTWSTVAYDTPAWEISALLDLVKLYAKHNRTKETDDLLEQVQQYSDNATDLQWSQAVLQVSSLKNDLQHLGSRPLNEVTEIMLSLNTSLSRVSPNLPAIILEHMLRLFQWVEYDPREFTNRIS